MRNRAYDEYLTYMIKIRERVDAIDNAIRVNNETEILMSIREVKNYGYT